MPDAGSGLLAVVPGRAGPPGPGRPLTYRAGGRGQGLPLDGADAAAQVHRVLTDPRGWQPIEGWRSPDRRAGADPADVASPALIDRLCLPLDTVGGLSCRNGDKVILNARRWATGVPAYAGRIDDYRAYLVNHEVGHRLGHGHEGCPAPARPRR